MIIILNGIIIVNTCWSFPGMFSYQIQQSNAKRCSGGEAFEGYGETWACSLVYVKQGSDRGGLRRQSFALFSTVEVLLYGFVLI